MTSKFKECSLCSNSYEGYGNNAYPYDGRCCDACNQNMVIPSRILLSTTKNKDRIWSEILDIKYELQGA
tara:strand:+ start:425 stop:631 length:207 start_codon:yes stop_codon:yes gene_type:complete